jgi:hypothetical protein
MITLAAALLCAATTVLAEPLLLECSGEFFNREGKRLFEKTYGIAVDQDKNVVSGLAFLTSHKITRIDLGTINFEEIVSGKRTGAGFINRLTGELYFSDSKGQYELQCKPTKQLF